LADGVLSARIKTISPVHIGSGRSDLISNNDFAAEGSRIWVIDLERMFEEAERSGIFDKVGFDAPINKLLGPDQYEKYSKYSLNNLPGINSIVEQIKTAHSCPYIPGSSLKGAIRTALAYAMVMDGVIKIQEGSIGDYPRTAGKSIESKLFGYNANEDVMRALQVSDTEGVSSISLDSVVLYSVRDRSGDQRLIPKEPRNNYTFAMEMIPENTELDLSIKIDNYLFSDKNSRELNFDSKKDWVRNFPKHCNDFSQAIIDSELRFHGKYHVPKMKAFYEMLDSQLKSLNREKQFLLQISWGTGWSSKTIGLALDDDMFYYVIDKFRLDKGRNTVFPKTQRIIERGNVAEMPLGWIRVDLS